MIKDNVSEVSEGIYQIGPYFDNDIIPHTSYVLIDEKEVVLINPGSKCNEEKVFAQINQIAINKPITKIIVMNPSVSHSSGLPFLASKSKRLTIITEWRSKLVLESYGIDAKYILMSKNRFKLTLASGRVLQFIKTPFLPNPGSFLIVDKQTKTLFSSDLYSTYDGGNIDFSNVSQMDSVLQYHETFFPSSDFVKPINNIISKLDITSIVTNTGSVYRKDAIKKVILEILKHEFYNSDFVVHNTSLINRTYDYINILNQFLLRLLNVFELDQVLNTFADSEINLDKESSLIISTTLKRRALYNRFFEIIYQKQGVLWLNILESSVNRIARIYYLPKPDIYKARSLELQEKVTVLESSNLDLISKTEKLQIALDDTLSKMLKCPITGLYNKQFFAQFISQNFDDTGALILIEMDDLERLNREYSYDIGTETIQHLYYIIYNHLPSDVLLFKGDGSSFILYCTNMDKEFVLAIATYYRNIIQESNSFIEDITVGMGIVFFNELDNETANNNWLFEQAYQRVNYAHQLGKGEIVYTSVVAEMKTIGSLLLVDDDSYNIGVIRRICERENILMYTCFDVYEALNYINTKNIDIIVSEINLSKLDAFHLKSELNKTLAFKNIPFIIASHNKNKNTITRANSLDVDYILNKPFYPEELIGILKRVLNK